MAAKGNRELVKLECTEGSGDFYVANVHKRAENKLELKKYNKKLRRHVVYKQKKLK